MNTIPLNNLVREKALLVTYIEPELENIRGTLSNLKEIVINQPDFGAPILGGSYKRRTMVKGVSDVDVYFEYSGAGNPQSALSILRVVFLIDTQRQLSNRISLQSWLISIRFRLMLRRIKKVFTE